MLSAFPLQLHVNASTKNSNLSTSSLPAGSVRGYPAKQPLTSSRKTFPVTHLHRFESFFPIPQQLTLLRHCGSNPEAALLSCCRENLYENTRAVTLKQQPWAQEGLMRAIKANQCLKAQHLLLCSWQLLFYPVGRSSCLWVPIPRNFSSAFPPQRKLCSLKESQDRSTV